MNLPAFWHNVCRSHHASVKIGVTKVCQEFGSLCFALNVLWYFMCNHGNLPNVAKNQGRSPQNVISFFFLTLEKLCPVPCVLLLQSDCFQYCRVSSECFQHVGRKTLSCICPVHSSPETVQGARQLHLAIRMDKHRACPFIPSICM